MRSFILVAIIICGVVFASSAKAELNGKKVVFIHGLQIVALDPRTTNQERFEDAREQAGPVLNSIIDEFIYYDSARRLTANTNTLYQQIKSLEARETCAQGCYFVTGSTGDLVARYIISRLGQWEVDSAKFNILLSVDIVGAGGGTELADVVVGLVQGGRFARTIRNAITQAFYGIRIPSATALLGIVNDLRPSIARRHANGQYNIPRLRVAAGGQIPIVSRFFITGRDDSTVPLHSACGSAIRESIQSCADKIKIDGRVSRADGPTALLYNYFPILMAEKMRHTQIDYKGKLVAVNNNSMFAHSTEGRLEYSLEETTYTKGFWKFKKRYRTVNKPKNDLAVQFLVDEFQ